MAKGFTLATEAYEEQNPQEGCTTEEHSRVPLSSPKALVSRSSTLRILKMMKRSYGAVAQWDIHVPLPKFFTLCGVEWSTES